MNKTTTFNTDRNFHARNDAVAVLLPRRTLLEIPPRPVVKPQTEAKK